jgi:hypothetical protein
MGEMGQCLPPVCKSSDAMRAVELGGKRGLSTYGQASCCCVIMLIFLSLMLLSLFSHQTRAAETNPRNAQEERTCIAPFIESL